MAGGDGQGTKAEAESHRLRHPLGPFRASPSLSQTRRRALMRELAGYPGDLRARISDLPPSELERAVRPGGWTVRQVVHHLGDAHLVGYLSAKLAATGDLPAIPPFDGAAWAKLREADEGTGVEDSLGLLASLHTRWVGFLRARPAEGFLREYMDPVRGRISLDVAIQYYTWHGRHHLAQIVGVVEVQTVETP